MLAHNNNYRFLKIINNYKKMDCHKSNYIRIIRIRKFGLFPIILVFIRYPLKEIQIVCVTEGINN